MMVKLSEIVQEMDGMGLEVYLHLPSNKIFQYFEGESTFSGLSEKEIAELPKAEQEEAKIGLSFDEFEADFLPFPSKYDIHKYKIMEDFANSVSNTNVQNGLLNSIRGSGAFRRFRNTLDRYNYTPKWYVFREKAFYEIAAEWCVDNHINFEDDRPMPKKSKKRASMEQIIQDWERNAAKKSDQNFQFLTSLKFKSASRVDKVAAEMHEEAFEKIDCKQCANCCKTAKPNLEMDDMERIATHLDMSIEELEHNYLVRDDQEEGKWLMNSLPCPFLSNDNLCTIYEVRPTACRDFPNTHKESFTSRRYQHSANSEICPASYYIVERLKEYFQG